MKRYAKFVIPAAVAVVVLMLLVFNLNSSLVYFNTPTELTEQEPGDSRLRLGGQVVSGTVTETTAGVSFVVTDGREAIHVVHVGTPQQLFQEGIGVVVEGTWDGDSFHSDTMLVKHDEQYRSEDGEYELENPPGEA